MFVLRHTGSFRHYIERVGEIPVMTKWTTVIAQAQVFDLKTDAERWKEYLRCHGSNTSVILTFDMIRMTEDVCSTT